MSVTTMTRAEREQFLAAPHVGVISIEQPDRAPLTVPVWYSYTPTGELYLTTYKDSRKETALRAAGRFSLCVQSEVWPYAFVSVEGAVLTIEPVDVERDVRPLARHYLGMEAGDTYVADLADSSAHLIVVRMRPQFWSASDYSKSG